MIRLFNLGSTNNSANTLVDVAEIQYVAVEDRWYVFYPPGLVINDQHVVNSKEAAIELALEFVSDYVILGEIYSATASGGTATVQFIESRGNWCVTYASGMKQWFDSEANAISAALEYDGNYVLLPASEYMENDFAGGGGESGAPITLPAPGLRELDQYLMTQYELPKDLILQLSKSGSNTIGGPKLSLELGIGLSDRIFMSDDRKKEARARYGSYNEDLRINALSEVEAEILVRYLSNEALQNLIASQRSLRRAFKKHKSDSTIATPTSFLIDVRGKPTPDKQRFDVPLMAVEVQFVDQNDVRLDMEYTIGCKGTINFVEAFNMTSGGIDTSRMSSVRTFTEVGVEGGQTNKMQPIKGSEISNFPRDYASGVLKSESYYHLLYQWGSNHRGAVELEIETPVMSQGTQWSGERVFTYDRVLNKNYDTEFAGTKKAKSQTLLFRDSFKVDGRNPEVLTLKIPVYVQPLPKHLVMTPDGIKSKWEMTGDVNNLPDHQKVELKMRLARPRSAELWENADFDGDFVISYDEYISPEGVAARRAGRAGASPVPNTELMFIPEATNSWIASKKTYVGYSSISGYLNITLPPGRWMISRISGDKFAKVEPDYPGAKTFLELSLIQQSLVQEQYGDTAPKFSYAPDTVPMAKISVPAAFYWRTIDEFDTTPTGMVGAKLIQDLTGVNQDVLSAFELRDSIPPLLAEKPATTDTIYQKLFGMYPTIEKSGYPVSNAGTATSRQVFDTAVMFFKEDSPYDLSQVGLYEKQLESEFDTSVQGFKDIKMPAINETIDYNGYKIKRVIVDTSITSNEISDGRFPGYTSWGPNNLELSYFPTNIVQKVATQSEYVASSIGPEDVYDIYLTMMEQHRSDGQSFEALVYYKEHTDATTEIISMYGIKHGTYHQKRLDDKIDEMTELGYESMIPSWIYTSSIDELHLFSTPSSAIIAGQFVPLKAPDHHNGWRDIEEMLEAQTEIEAMREVLRWIDTGGNPKFPPGDTSSEIHAYMANEEGGPRKYGDDFPGSLVFFQADLFPTAMVPFPPGMGLVASDMAGAYLGAAQASVDFIQNMGSLTAPQPSLDDNDDYNMGYGLL